MAIEMSSLIMRAAPKPPMIFLYSPEGTGKTSIGAYSPSPIFMCFEDGMGDLEAARFPKIIKDYDYILECIEFLGNEEHDFKTLVIDTADHLEPVIWKEACDRNKWANIEAPGYGKGYEAALDVWREFIGALRYLRDHKGMAIVILAHSRINHFDAPDTEPYDHYTPKLHESKGGRGANSLLRELCDAVLFMNRRVSIVKDGKAPANGKADTRNARGVGGNVRFIQTENQPAAIAKRRTGTFLPGTPTRIDLPENPALSWDTLAKHLTYYTGE